MTEAATIIAEALRKNRLSFGDFLFEDRKAGGSLFLLPGGY